jgi:glycosyltransferase involved in cell wall biosynthesis
MKIGFDAKRAFCTQAGLGQYSRQHIRMIAGEFPEWELHLFTPEIRIQEFVNEISAYSNVYIHSNSGGASWYWRSYGIVKSLENFGLNLFHGLSNELPRGLAIPSVITLHDIIPFQDPSFQPLAQNLIYRWKMRHGIKHANQIICVSKFTQTATAGHFPKSTEKLLHLPPVFEFIGSKDGPSKRSRDGRPYILAVGTLEARKNIGTLLEAFALLTDKTEHRLVLLGKFTPFTASLQEFAINAGIAHRVDFIGAVSEEDKWAWYRGADLLTYPSILEGFGLPALEALIFEKPLIISENTAVSEAAGNCAYTAPGRDAEAWAAQIMHALSNPLQADVEQIRAHITQFSAKALAPKWEKVYKITAGLR